MLTDRKGEIVDFLSYNGCWYVHKSTNQCCFGGSNYGLKTFGDICDEFSCLFPWWVQC